MVQEGTKKKKKKRDAFGPVRELTGGTTQQAHVSDARIPLVDPKFVFVEIRGFIDDLQ